MAGDSAQLRTDLVRYLGPFIGEVKAAGIYDSIMSAIREEAGTGASAKVTPLIIGSLAVSGLIAAAGIGMLMASRRRGMLRASER